MTEARSAVEETNARTAEPDENRRRRFDFYIVALLITIAVTRVATTYPVFNHTFDEPVHIAMGLQWLDDGTYEGLYQTPPLARIILALGPWMAGMEYPAIEGDTRDVPVLRSGLTILYTNGSYLRALTLARVGNLLFLVLASIAVWRLGVVWSGRAGGLVATLFFTTTPVILGHAGVATTDIAVTAGIAWVMLAMWHLLDTGSWKAACLFALATALTILTKLTFFLFGVTAIIAAAACWLVARRSGFDTRENAWQIALRSAVACLLIVPITIWAGYRFQSWPASHLLNAAGTPLLLRIAGLFDALGLQVPAPQFLLALDVISRLNEAGTYPSYLLGTVDPSGFIYYYPVIIAYKVPLALTALTLAALMLVRGSWNNACWPSVIPAAIVVGMLAAGVFIRTNEGIRYIVPILAFMSLAASGAVLRMWAALRVPVARAAFAAVVAIAILAPGFLTHPDYLPYFNFLAGDHPQRISIGSDLDWGQDLLRLRDEVEMRGISRLSLLYFGTALPREQGFTARIDVVRPDRPVEGWLAVSIMRRAGILPGDAGIRWLDDYEPVTTVGRSMLLYQIPPAAMRGASAGGPQPD